MIRRPWTAADDALLCSLWGTDTPRSEIAARLGRTQAATKNRASKIGATNPKPPRWTARDLFQLDMLLDQGLPDAAIARRLKRTPEAINLARKRHGLQSRSDRLMSARTVADLMGLGCAKTVTRWMQRGYLAGKRGPCRGPHRQWQVDEEALWRFIENRRHWHRWQPERITDAGLREWAMELRDGVRFLTPGEVAWRLCVGTATVNTWIRGGLLPAVRNGNWLIRESDLEGFTPPGQLPKTGMSRDLWSGEETERLREMRESGMSYAECAIALGRSIASCSNRWYRLTEAEREAA